MRKKLLCKAILNAFLLFTTYWCTAQDASVSHHNAVIWRGFNHRWTYNHRLKRFGNYISYSGNCNNISDSILVAPHGYHYSASGIGKDSTFFTSYYSCVSSPNAVFAETKVKVIISNKLKQLTSKTKTDILEFTKTSYPWMKNKAAYTAILNGFDMTASDLENPPDKISLLKIAVEDSLYDPVSNKFTFKVKADAVFDCQSAECTGGNDLKYEVNIYVLVVGFEKDCGAFTQNLYSNAYSWGTCKEANPKLVSNIVTGNLSPDFRDATIGIKSFTMTLNQGLHLLQLNAHVDSPTFESKDRHLLNVSGDYYFKQWRKGMKFSPVARCSSFLSFRQSGYEVFDMDLVVLQFKKADIRYYQYSDSMYWPGKESTSVYDPMSEKGFKLKHLPDWEIDIGKVNK